MRSLVIAESGDRIDVTFRDGAQAQVPVRPERVVSMLPGLTEILDMLGVGESLVGVSPHCDTPAYVAELPRLSVLPVDYEVLVALEPDLVVTDGTLHGLEVAEMRRRGLAVIPLESSRSLEHLATTVDLLAQIWGEAGPLEAARQFRDELEAALRAARPVSEYQPPLVLLLAGVEPLYALGPGSLLDDMVCACGGINLACDLGRASGPFASELVPARRPDWILTTESHFPGILRERWRDLPAVEADQVASVGGDAFLRAGPRTPEALRRLADVLHGRVPANLLGGER